MCQVDCQLDQLDRCLRQLALEAQQYPPHTLERRQTVGKLLRVMQNSGRLCRPSCPGFSGLYEEIYAIALQKLFCYIYERIDHYDSTRGEVLQWANFLLRRRLPEAIRELSHPREVQRFNLDDLEKNSASQPNSPSEELLQCLKEDPEGIFTSRHIVNHPQAHFQFIALKKVSGYTWKEISRELNISVQTLSSFYQRCLKEFTPMLQKYLSS